jgi:transmembrane sensor
MDSKQIEERASVWLAQRESGEWSARHDAQLKDWLDASMGHYIAFIRLEVAWEEARRLKALRAGRARGRVPPRGEWQLSPFVERGKRRQERRRTKAEPLRLAAGVLLVLGLGAAVTTAYFRGDGFSTPIGAVATLPMADGTRITLNTDSRIRMSLDDDVRRVALNRGEAFFQVAKDANRPFVVTAGGQRVQVIGTAFSVRLEGDDVRVVVTEGLVQLAGTPLPAGSDARVVDGRMQIEQKPVGRLEDYLSWRTGYLVFQEVGLHEAVAEFNRYNKRKLSIGDSEVAAVRFSGRLSATNVDALLRVLETGFEVEARTVGEQIVLGKKKSSSGN